MTALFVPTSFVATVPVPLTVTTSPAISAETVVRSAPAALSVASYTRVPLTVVSSGVIESVLPAASRL